MLRGLKLEGMAQTVGDLVEQGAPAFDVAWATLPLPLERFPVRWNS